MKPNRKVIIVLTLDTLSCRAFANNKQAAEFSGYSPEYISLKLKESTKFATKTHVFFRDSITNYQGQIE